MFGGAPEIRTNTFSIMKGSFWNSDGIGDPDKHSFIHETIREHKLDFFALLETGRSNFNAPFLKHLSGGLHFAWYCLPSHGRSGGILVGINTASLHVKNIVTSDHCVKLHLRFKLDGFEWALVAVYGAAQDAQKPEFLSELVRICESEPLPMLIGGDFNIIRHREEKNNDNFNEDGLLFSTRSLRVLT